MGQEARSDYLVQVCGGDQGLRNRVEGLLKVHEWERDFLKSSPEPALLSISPKSLNAPARPLVGIALWNKSVQGVWAWSLSPSRTSASLHSTLRIAITTSFVILSFLTAGIVITSWLANRAHREAQRANQALQMFADSSYSEAVAAALAGDSDRAEETLKKAEAHGLSTYRVNVLKGLIALNQGDLDGAVGFAEQALRDEPSGGDSGRIGGYALLSLYVHKCRLRRSVLSSNVQVAAPDAANGVRSSDSGTRATDARPWQGVRSYRDSAEDQLFTGRTFDTRQCDEV